MPLHLPDSHKYYPAVEEQVIAVFRNQDRQKRYNFLDITTGVSRGVDLVRSFALRPVSPPNIQQSYWKEGYKITDSVHGYEDVFCPGLLYPRSLTVDKVWSLIAERLGAYVFSTPTDWSPDSDEDDSYNHSREQEARCTEWGGGTTEREPGERCVMCADRRAYWAVSPPVFLSRHSRRWHVHTDCLHHLMPRRQFGLKPIEVVEYV
ncbi:hypothetical protein DXG03_008793 [Asterophora parasitica]|uniref:Uncharacterized protein n=1 Tax=Asterophora parasitica TaxID=117018 RepID=A0A9P7G7K4_9AGAR|nr:hypothetical protein DXG03_008793 [Asterophora parasitica]